MLNFNDFYLLEKTIDVNKSTLHLNQSDKVCIDFGKEMSDKYGLILNGWQEITYYFTIPKGLPNEKNTFSAKNEKELIEKIHDRFPLFFDYLKTKFPDGFDMYDDLPPTECGKPFDDM